MINGTWRRLLQDVRVKRGADVGSDHPPSCHGNRKGEAEEKRTWQGKTWQFDVQKLKEPKAKSTFSFQLKNKFRALEHAENHTTLGTSDINTMTGQIRIAYTHTSEAWLGLRRKETNEWITGDACKAIESRRALKYKVMDTRSKRLKDRFVQQYRETDRTVKRTLRATNGVIWNT